MIYLTWSLAVVLGITLATLVVDFIIAAPKTSGVESAHFDGKRFRNIDESRARTMWDVFKLTLSREKGKWKKKTLIDTPYKSIPDNISPAGDEAVFTFVNHATFLIQTHGLNILTDPIWSERASPFQWVGPERMRPPGIRFGDLPDIHVVLVSHNHYDHLDINTVEKLSREHDPLFIVPLGVAAYLENNGIYNNIELDWWQQHEYNHHLSISGVPAQHFSGRGLTDRDKTLWCGYMLELPNGNIYFAGDTGYDDFFDQIRRRFAPIDTALIPIGAYHPRWFMEPIHVDPEQAVKIHRDVNARRSIGMHFGTFPLANEGMRQPVEELAKARKKYNVGDNEFLTLEEGSSLRVSLAATKKAAVG